MSEKKKILVASAGSKDKLKEIISEYWMCESWMIFLSDLGHIKKKGKIMFGFSWVKKGGRYRFEAD